MINAKHLQQQTKHCKTHKRFSCDSRQMGESLFGIYHYAGPVEYTTEGFLEKNKDELPKQATDLLMSSSRSFVKKLASAMEPLPLKKSSLGRSKKQQTVGGQFVEQLQSLRDKIDITHPHYIRCLKPNSDLEAGVFTKHMVAHQLKCAGVLKAVQVSRVGFSQRFLHAKFLERYRFLAYSALNKIKNQGAKRKADVLVVSVKSNMCEEDS